MTAAAKGFGGRGFGYAKMKRKWTDDIALIVRGARVPQVTCAFFRFEWRETTKRRNPDNIAAAKKFIFDGLVTAGVLANDGWGEVLGWADSFVVAPRPGVVVTIEPM